MIPSLVAMASAIYFLTFNTSETCLADCTDTSKLVETVATDEEIELMARVVMSEASILSIEAKQAVAEVIINRMYSEDFPNTIKEVITQKNAFSVADNGEPTPECYTAVKWSLEQRVFPTDMYWFRESYVDYGYEYVRFSNLYFSTKTDCLNEQKGIVYYEDFN